MKAKQITIITIAAVLLFTLAGCEEPKGYLERKATKPELEESKIFWTVKGPVDASGNPVELEEVK